MLIDISQCIYILLSLGILFEQVQLLCIFELFVHSKKFHSTLPFLLALYAAHHAMLVELSPAPTAVRFSSYFDHPDRKLTYVAADHLVQQFFRLLYRFRNVPKTVHDVRKVL